MLTSPSIATSDPPGPMPRSAPTARPGTATPELRHQILDAADTLLRTEGVGALSMREVARRAGVSHQAPYHHFADREAILAELVIDGFRLLADRLRRANDGADGHGAHRMLRDCSGAYVGYALDHPGRFGILFRSELCDRARFPAVVEAGERAYAQLQRMVRTVYGADDDTLATLHWSQVHGLAVLLVEGMLAHKLVTLKSRRAHADAVLDRVARIAAEDAASHRLR